MCFHHRVRADWDRLRTSALYNKDAFYVDPGHQSIARCRQRRREQPKARAHSTHSRHDYPHSGLSRQAVRLQNGGQQVLAGALLDCRAHLPAQHQNPELAPGAELCAHGLRGMAGGQLPVGARPDGRHRQGAQSAAKGQSGDFWRPGGPAFCQRRGPRGPRRMDGGQPAGAAQPARFLHLAALG